MPPPGQGSGKSLAAIISKTVFPLFNGRVSEAYTTSGDQSDGMSVLAGWAELFQFRGGTGNRVGSRKYLIQMNCGGVPDISIRYTMDNSLPTLDSPEYTEPIHYWASDIEVLMSDNTIHSAEGFWFLADIDFSFLSAKTIRVNITLPEYKLAIIDRKAKEKGLSRSAFLIESAEKAI